MTILALTLTLAGAIAPPATAAPLDSAQATAQVTTQIRTQITAQVATQTASQVTTQTTSQRQSSTLSTIPTTSPPSGSTPSSTLNGAPKALAPRLFLGSPASDATIQALDIDILPDGRGLPPGDGTVNEGLQVYNDQCVSCHGEGGQNGAQPPLAGGLGLTPAQLTLDPTLPKTIGNYWAYATTVFDYIRRAMPLNRPGSLSNDEVYAVTAYLLYLNQLISSDQTINAQSLPAVVMPAQQYYRSAYPMEAASP